MDWAAERYGIELKTVCDIGPVEQLPEELDALESLILQFDDFALAGLVAAATLLGSAVLALALREGRLGADEALTTAELDAAYQSEIWGGDPVAAAANVKKRDELSEIARFFLLTRAG